MLHAAVLLLVMFLTGPATAQSLTDAEVDAAIAAGQNRKLKDLIADCTAKPGFGSAFGSAMAGGLQPSGAYDVSFATSAGRVALHAAQAKRLYKPFTRDDVTSDMRQPAGTIRRGFVGCTESNGHTEPRSQATKYWRGGHGCPALSARFGPRQPQVPARSAPCARTRRHRSAIGALQGREDIRADPVLLVDRRHQRVPQVERAPEIAGGARAFTRLAVGLEGVQSGDHGVPRVQ